MTSQAVIPFLFEKNCIRTVVINNNPWFIANDVCNVLAISNTTEAVRKLDDDEKALYSIEGLSRGNDQANIISESGMYTLILRSRDAVKQGTVPHRFRKWVTNELLPQIRKTGSYHAPQQPKYHPQSPELLSHDDLELAPYFMMYTNLMTYPLKFRQHVLAIKEKEKLTYAKTASRFGVGMASLMRWNRRITPCTTHNKPATKIDMEALAQDVATYPDDYQYERAQRFGVSAQGIRHALKRLRVSRKKNTSASQS